MSDALFVYGTLGPGKPNEHIMLAIGGEWFAGRVKGHLVNEGWGAEQGCPAIIPAQDGEWVEGHIFVSNNLSAHWQQLDDFEGSEYTRTLVEVDMENADNYQAYIYALNR